MAGITATFQADFSSFEQACASAQTSLQAVDTSASNVGDTFTKLGAKLPAAFGSLGDTATKTSAVTKAFGEFDSALAAGGIHLSQTVKGLAEIAAAAGEAGVALSLFTEVGLAIGTFFTVLAGARWVIGFFKDFDNNVAKAAASLLGFGDNAGQVAGANLDKLAAASQKAKRDITDLAEATEVLKGGMLATKTPFEVAAAAIRAWHTDIARIKSEGNLDQLNADLKLAIIPLDQLAKQYKTTAEALQMYQKEQAKIAANRKEDLADLRKHNDAVADLLTAGDDYQKVLKNVAQADFLAAKAALEHGASASAVGAVYKLSGPQVQAITKIIAEQTAMQTKGNEAIADTNKLLEDTARLRASQTSTPLQAQLAEINATFDAMSRAAIQSGKDTDESNQARAAARKANLDGALVDFKTLNDANSDFYRRQLEDQATAAEAMYQVAATAAQGYSAEAVAYFRDASQAARMAANEWFISFVDVGKKVSQVMAGSVTQGPSIFSTAGPEPGRQAYSYQVTPTIQPGQGNRTGTVVNNTFNVNGSVKDIGAQLVDYITKSLMKPGKQYPKN